MLLFDVIIHICIIVTLCIFFSGNAVYGVDSETYSPSGKDKTL